jgi:hypothetical protein
MLARFALDPDAVKSASDGEHKRLLREWMNYGVLVYDSPSFEASELASTVESLPTASKTLWKQILRRTWLRPSQVPWSGVLGLDDNPQALSAVEKDLDLLCLEETRLEILREELCRGAPAVELGDLREIDNTAAFERAHELAQKRTGGMTVQKLWQERFALPASLARNITIVDRFALADGEGINGLEAFLVLLDGTGKKTNVTLYSSYGDEKLKLSELDAQNRVVNIRNRLARGGVGDIKLFLTDSRRFGYVEHDRFFKFDHLVFEIGSGMAVFNGPKVKQSTFSSKTEQAGHKATLVALQKLCSAAYPVNV